MQIAQTIAIYRQRIANAAIARMVKKNGGHFICVRYKDGTTGTMDISNRTLLELLMRFERHAKQEYGASSMMSVRDVYQQCLGVNERGEYLTEQGQLIIDELVNELREHVRKQHKAEVSDG